MCVTSFLVIIIIIIISILIKSHIMRMGYNPPRSHSADWWLLTANAAETNGLTYHPKHGGARDSNVLATNPMVNVA
jgi:hypothetical protein